MATSKRQTLSEDAEDLEVFERRGREPNLDFDDVVAKLRRHEIADRKEAHPKRGR